MTETLPAVRKMLFIGMNNPRGDEAFWPSPHGSTGHRLWQLINDAVGWPRDEFLGRTDRVNFCDGAHWNYERAMARIPELHALAMGRRTICVGKVAARLMDAPIDPFVWDGHITWIPHTSGVARWMNDPDARQMAVDFLRGALE